VQLLFMQVFSSLLVLSPSQAQICSLT
jgi:hypothetical protein